jgi:iron(II)-dependent oxidoreductase
MQEEQVRPEEIEVRLKPLLGMRPTTYVPIIYSILLAVVLFLILVLPGLKYHGARVTFDVVPAESSIRIDGVPVGTAPGTVFISSGDRSIEVRHPGFASHSEQIEVPGRLVGSLLFPRKISIDVRLQPEGTAEHADEVGVEFARWSLNGEATGQYQFPPIARTLGRDLGSLGPEHAEVADVWERFQTNVLPNVTSQALLVDLVAGSLLRSGGGAATPEAIAALVRSAAQVSDLVDGLPLQLHEVAGETQGARLESSEWYAHAASVTSRAADREVAGAVDSPAGETGVSISVPQLDLVFRVMTGGEVFTGGVPRAARGGDLPSYRSVRSFGVSDTAVSVNAFAAFLSENPQWLPANREALVARKLVDDQYLLHWDEMQNNPALPVTEISWYAATAFADWVADRYLAGRGDVRLPTEDEWNLLLQTGQPEGGVFAGAEVTGPVAVRSAGGAVGGVIGVAGNVWEWIEDWYGFYTPLYPVSLPGPAAHKVVRGGSWVTNRATYDDHDRGSLPPEWTSAYVGFRLAIEL